MHDFPHGTLHTRGEFLLVIGLAVFFRPHELHEPRRTYQAADVGGENPVCTPLHGLPPDGSCSTFVVACYTPSQREEFNGQLARFSFLSHYQTAVAVKHALSADADVEHARIGIEEP